MIMTLNELWIKYIFWRDMGDHTRASYYMARIKEIEKEQTTK
jgi:hypothetical protein